MTAASLTLRAPVPDDVPRLVAFFGDLERAHGAGGVTEAEVRDWFRSRFFDAEEDARLALGDGEIVGVSTVWDRNRAHDTFFAFTRAYRRELGVYRALLDWAEERARASADAGAVLRVTAASDDEALAHELPERGFRLVRHFFTMEIDLTEPVPAPEWPEGITVRTFRPGDERAVYDADMEAFADHWDHVPTPFDEWCDYFVESADFDPSLWFLAEEDGQLAGIALCRGERRPDTGYVGVLAVRRPWRRRGLGRALLLHASDEFRRRGRPKADLGVDADNLTGAVRLYEQAGMRVARRQDTYEKQL